MAVMPGDDVDHEWAGSVSEQLNPSSDTACAVDRHQLAKALELQQAARSAEAEMIYKSVLSRGVQSVPGWINYGVLLKKQGRIDEAVECYMQALRMEPKNSDIFFNLGNALSDLGQDDRAAHAWRQAIALDSEHDGAFTNLGLLLLKEGKYNESCIMLDRAAQLTQSARSYSNLGLVLNRRKEFEAALACNLRSFRLDPDNVEFRLHVAETLVQLGQYEESVNHYRALLNNHAHRPDIQAGLGHALVAMVDFNGAMSCFEQAIKSAPGHVQAHIGRALVLLYQKNYPLGLSEYEWRWKLRECPTRRFKVPEWSNQNIYGLTLLVHAEQGLGDTIQFSRFLPLATSKGARIVFECQPELVNVFKNFPGVDAVVARGVCLPAFNAHISLLSLPRLLGLTADTIPVPVSLSDLGNVKDMSRIIPEQLPGIRLKVGIVWAGNPGHSNDRFRSIGVEKFFGMVEVPGVSLFSLQTGDRSNDLRTSGGEYLVFDLAPHLRTFSDTVAMLQNLDLVVTVDTAIAHLAGTLGKPVWLLLPWLPDWRWGIEGEITPWYPTMKIFRQKPGQDWGIVFNAVIGSLHDAVSGVSQGPVPSMNEWVATEKIYKRALSFQKAGDIDKSLQYYVAALRRDPTRSGAWNNLGIALRNKKHYFAAKACYRRALALDGPQRGGLSNLGNVLTDLGMTGEAIKCHRQAVALEQDNLTNIHNLGIALKQGGHLDEALACFDKTVSGRSDSWEARWDRSHALLQSGKLAMGWRDYESRWNLPESCPRNYPMQVWEGQRFDGRTLLLYCEQGFGDTILMARYLPWVKRLGGRVVLECQEPLIRLLSGIQSGADRLVPKGSQIDEPFDFHLPLMSLPEVFKTELDTIPPAPYISLPEPVPSLSKLMAGQGLKVGIVWSGSETFKGNRFRATELKRFLRFASFPGIKLFSLQKGAREDDVRQLGVHSLVTDLSGYLNDFYDTASVLGMLDIVVMTDSSVAHLAGAVGKPVWILLGQAPYWLWLQDRDDSPWYASMRIFRQKQSGDWDELFERVAVELEDLVSDKLSCSTIQNA